MEMNHVSDEEIQAYLVRGTLSNREHFFEHLRNCELCRKQLAAYRVVYETLKNDEGMLLSADFSEKVVREVAGDTRTNERLREFLLIGLSALVSIGTFIWMINLQHLFQIGKTLVHSITTTLVTEIPFLNRINLSLLISGLLILLFINLLDNVLHTMKHH